MKVLACLPGDVMSGRRGLTDRYQLGYIATFFETFSKQGVAYELVPVDTGAQADATVAEAV